MEKETDEEFLERLKLEIERSRRPRNSTGKRACPMSIPKTKKYIMSTLIRQPKKITNSGHANSILTLSYIGYLLDDGLMSSRTS